MRNDVLQLNQLMTLSQEDSRTWKNEYSIEYFKSGSAADGAGEYLSFVAVVTGGSSPRNPSIKLFSEKVHAGSPCKVSCSCPYFRIKLAMPLYSSGSTDMKVRRSDIPDKYNGIQKPGLCPHLMKLAAAVLSSNNTELDSVRQSSRNTSVSDALRRLT